MKRFQTTHQQFLIPRINHFIPRMLVMHPKHRRAVKVLCATVFNRRLHFSQSVQVVLEAVDIIAGQIIGKRIIIRIYHGIEGMQILLELLFTIPCFEPRTDASPVPYIRLRNLFECHCLLRSNP